MRNAIPTAVFLLTTLIVFAQTKSRADRLYERGAYLEAAQLYEKLDLDDAQSIKRIADCYYLNVDMESASQWYKILLEDYPSEADNTYIFRYAQSLKGIKDYAQADHWMSKYNASVGEVISEQRTLDYITQIDKEVPKHFALNRSRINSNYSEFGTAYYGNRVVFASSSNTLHNRTYMYNEQPYLDLFVGTIDEQGDITNPVLFSKDIATQTHEATPVFTKDLKTMYFTRTNKDKVVINGRKVHNLKLFRARYKNGKWGDAEELPFNSDEYSCGHPALSPDQSKLYFVSDMPGTIGETDIFEVQIRGNNRYGVPRNLGPTINTDKREKFPYITQDSTLYFSSDGHLGLGSLDVFSSENDGYGFLPPKNLGSSINSNLDDFAFVIDETKTQGFVSSNRGNSDNDDIYFFKEKCSRMVKGTVRDRYTGELLPRATVQLFDSSRRRVNVIIADENGGFDFEMACKLGVYKAEGSKEHYDKDEQVFEIKADDQADLELALNLMPTVAGIGQDLTGILRLEPILFDYNESYITPEAEIELKKVIDYMYEHPTTKIDVRSHTDSRGGDKYNYRLSNRRNKSTKAYIIDKGNINPNRISGKGYGETRHVNKCANGVRCSEEQHQRNRRSEFIVVEN